ncbi:MAG: GYD domain-containing protein [Planctomycetota bacterium]
MPKYLIQASYVGEGLKGLLKEGGSSRQAAVGTVVKGMGGTLESFYYAFGEDDVLGIADFPDNVTAAAFALAINASGAVKARTTVLMTPEEVDKAANKTVDYRPPGQ